MEKRRNAVRKDGGLYFHFSIRFPEMAKAVLGNGRRRKMSLNILDNQDWKRLSEGAKSIPENWNLRVIKAIRREKTEAEKKYGVRIGQTETYCLRCKKPCCPGNHACRDIYFEKLKEKKKKIQAEASKPLLDKIEAVGRQRVAEMLQIPEERLRQWIHRENVPETHREAIRTL
jgi:hypothetical protein